VSSHGQDVADRQAEALLARGRAVLDAAPPWPDPPTWAEIFARAERLVRSVAPELDRTPIYLLSQEGTPFAGSRLAAFTGFGVDALLKEHLGERWCGFGVAVVMNTPHFEEAVPRASLADVVAAYGIHETGHSLADGWALLCATLP